LVGDPVAVDTGNDSSLDGIASEIGHKAACVTPPTCAVLSGVSSSNEVMVQNHMIGHEKAVGYIDATMIPQKQSDSDCLNLDQFLNSDPDVQDGVARDEC